MARFIQGDRPEAGAELAMTGWKLARLFLGVALVIGGQGGRQRIEMIRRRRNDVLPLILRRHPDRRAAVAAIMWQAPQDVLWRHRIFRRQRRRLAAEALGAEAGEETVCDRGIRIPRP
jgi:hypothetical protein